MELCRWQKTTKSNDYCQSWWIVVDRPKPHNHLLEGFDGGPAMIVSENGEPILSKKAKSEKLLPPLLLAFWGALGAGIAPAVQFVNGYWEMKLKEKEFSHNIALDFAKLALNETSSREYRKATLEVIASIDENPLQQWASRALDEVTDDDEVIIEALRARSAPSPYKTASECITYLEMQSELVRYLVVTKFKQEGLSRQLLDESPKDSFISNIEQDCRKLQVPALATSSPVQTAPPASCSNEGRSLEITADKLRKIYLKATASDIDKYWQPLQTELSLLSLNCTGVAMLLAQIGHESGELRFSEEIASGSAYEGRSDLGNVNKGDGELFKGRGLFLMAGRANYEAFAKYSGNPDILSNPASVSSNPELAVQTATWLWATRIARGNIDQGDLQAVTRRLSGGYYGLENRRRLFELAKAAL